MRCIGDISSVSYYICDICPLCLFILNISRVYGLLCHVNKRREVFQDCDVKHFQMLRIVQIYLF